MAEGCFNRVNDSRFWRNLGEVSPQWGEDRRSKSASKIRSMKWSRADHESFFLAFKSTPALSAIAALEQIQDCDKLSDAANPGSSSRERAIEIVIEDQTPICSIGLSCRQRQ
jgi:hypothetical protein